MNTASTSAAYHYRLVFTDLICHRLCDYLSQTSLQGIQNHSNLRMAQTTDKIPLNIILIGKSGHGKSATGNSILGRKAFKTSSNATSETKVMTDAWAEHGEYEVKVVDGPGLEVTALNGIKAKEQMFENMAKALKMCNGGIHAVALVVKFGFRCTEEERKTISNLKQIFGENYVKDHGIIVMTGGDSFSVQMEADGTPGKTFQEWCREQGEVLGNLIEECSPRVVLFNNLSTSEEERTRQRNELLFHAGQLPKIRALYITEHFQTYAQVRSKFIKDSKQKILEETIPRNKLPLNAGQLQKVNVPDTTEHFQTYEQVRSKFIKDSKQKILEETMQKRISLLSAELEQLSVDSSLEDVHKLDARIKDVYTQVGEESLKEESMQQFTGSLKRLSTITEKLRRSIREKNLSAMASNVIGECSPRVALSDDLPPSEDKKPRQRNELLFHEEHLQKESTPTCRMSQTADTIPLNIILIGKTGHGKSTTGNSIVGRRAFQTSSNALSETKVVTDAWAKHGAYEVKVVDGPGLEDTDLDAVKNKEQACENMATALMMCNGGINAFVLVIKFSSRYTEEERRTISDLKQIFGDNYLKDHGIIVITGGDSFSGQMETDGTPGKTFNEWCCEQHNAFGNLIEECSPRVILFNNLSKSNDKTRQRNKLLFYARQLQKEKGFYTTEHFQAYAQVREKFIKDSKQKILEETIQKRVDLLAAELGQLSVDSSLEDVDKLDARITDAHTEIGEESSQEESLQPLIDSLKRLRATTEELRRAIREKNPRVMTSHLGVMSQHQEELNKTRKSPWARITASVRVGFAVAASGGSLVSVVNSMGRVLFGAAVNYLSNK